MPIPGDISCAIDGECDQKFCPNCPMCIVYEEEDRDFEVDAETASCLNGGPDCDGMYASDHDEHRGFHAEVNNVHVQVNKTSGGLNIYHEVQITKYVSIGWRMPVEGNKEFIGMADHDGDIHVNLTHRGCRSAMLMNAR